MKLLQALFIVLIITGIGLTGCAKKVTKIEPLTEPPKPPVAAPAPEPAPKPAVEQFVPVDLDAQLREILQTVYFDFDKYDLRPDAISSLGKIAGYLQDHKSIRLLAEGHCDERGSSEYNMGLGENRAKAVKNYLVSYGIAADRLETTSYGKERPAQMNCGSDDNCGQKNRRVEWKALAK
jgi:peptidoglycan-associated lipoprotein